MQTVKMAGLSTNEFCPATLVVTTGGGWPHCD